MRFRLSRFNVQVGAALTGYSSFLTRIFLVDGVSKPADIVPALEISYATGMSSSDKLAYLVAAKRRATEAAEGDFVGTYSATVTTSALSGAWSSIGEENTTALQAATTVILISKNDAWASHCVWLCAA